QRACDLSGGGATLVKFGWVLHEPMKSLHQLRNQVRCARLAGDLCCFGHHKVRPILKKGLELCGSARTSRFTLKSAKPVKRLFNWIRLLQSNTQCLKLGAIFVKE